MTGWISAGSGAQFQNLFLHNDLVVHLTWPQCWAVFIAVGPGFNVNGTAIPDISSFHNSSHLLWKTALFRQQRNLISLSITFHLQTNLGKTYPDNIENPLQEQTSIQLNFCVSQQCSGVMSETLLSHLLLDIRSFMLLI